jgi:ubiquinone biosynthesis monooxygenase Coq7
MTTSTKVGSMVRVNHAGEFGAVRIYDGQIAVLGKRPVGKILRHMRDQEREHLASFAQVMAVRSVRPTVMLPLWHFGGFALGAVTAVLGERVAMACTEAVEDTVVDHYDRQLESLPRGEEDLSLLIERVRDEERAHGDDAIAQGAQRAPGHAILYSLISAGCRAAIRISEKF